MSGNVIRRSNVIQVGRLWKLIAFVVVLAGLSLVFVFLRVRNVKLADEVRKLELALVDINKRNAVLQLDIERATKPRTLQQKVASLNLNLVSLAELPKVEARVSRFDSSNYRALVQKENAP